MTVPKDAAERSPNLESLRHSPVLRGGQNTVGSGWQYIVTQEQRHTQQLVQEIYWGRGRAKRVKDHVGIKIRGGKRNETRAKIVFQSDPCKP